MRIVLNEVRVFLILIIDFNFTGQSNLIACFIHIFIGLYLFKKHKFQRETIFFILFYLIIGLSLFFIFIYESYFPITILELKILYSFVYSLSFFGIFSLMIGAEYLIRKVKIHTLIYTIFTIMGILLLLLQQTEITHVLETRRPIFTILYGLLLMIYLSIPPLYLLYLLFTMKMSNFSKTNQKTIVKLRIAFLVYLIYPFSNSLSNTFSTLSELAVLEFVFLVASVIIFLSLPNVNNWIIDIIKMHIETNISKFITLPNDIEKTWQKLERWEKKVRDTNASLNMTDIKSYLQQIAEMTLEED